MGHPRSHPRRLTAQVSAGALALLCAAAASGCLTPPVLALARPTVKRQSYQTTIESVDRAARLDSGGLIVCMEILTWLNAREKVHLTVPLEKLAALRERKSLDFGRDEGFESSSSSNPPTLRYVFFEKQLRPGCPDGSHPVPIQSLESSNGGSPVGASPDESIQEALYTGPSDRGVAIRYRSPELLWSSLHDVDLAPVLGGEKVEEVPGRPAYYFVLPFAILFDALLAAVYIFA